MTTRPRESTEESKHDAISSLLDALVGSVKYQGILQKLRDLPENRQTETKSQKLQEEILTTSIDNLLDDQYSELLDPFRPTLPEQKRTKRGKQKQTEPPPVSLVDILPQKLAERIYYSYRRPALDALSKINVAYDEFTRDFSKLAEVEYKEDPEYPITQEEIEERSQYLPLLAPPEKDEHGNEIDVKGLEDGTIITIVAAMQQQIQLVDALKNDFRIYFKTPYSINMKKDDQKHQRLTIITQITDLSGKNFEPEHPIYPPEEKQFFHGLSVGPERLLQRPQLITGKHANVIIIDYHPTYGGRVCLTDSSQFIDDFIDNFEKLGTTTSEDIDKRIHIIREFGRITGIGEGLAWNISREDILNEYIHKILCPTGRVKDPISAFLNNRPNSTIHYSLLRLPIRNSVGPNCMRLALATAYYFNFIDPSYEGLQYFLDHDNRWLSTTNVNTILDTNYPFILSEMVLRFQNKDYLKSKKVKRSGGKLSLTYY